MAKISLSYPDTGLTISISVKNRDTGVEDFSGTMTEVETTREYKYDFTEVVNTDYVYVATVTGYSNMSGVIYRDGGGLTTEESEHLLQLVNSTGGGGFSINYNAINSHTTSKVNEIKEQIEKLPDYTGKLNDINSHIKLVKEEIIDTIEESKNDICKDIKTVNKELQEDNVSTRQLVRQKAKKQEEFIQKQLDSEAKTQKMIESEADEIEEEIQKIYTDEAETIEKEIMAQYEKEADEIESNS